MASLQAELMGEASSLTRALYRRCLRSVEVLAGGNQRDEDDFAEREEMERSRFDGTGGVADFDRISMAPPVSRRNELASRANYYRSFARENFDGHWNLLGPHGFHIGDEGNMRHGLGGSAATQLDGGGGGRGWNQYRGGHHHLGGQMPAQYQGGESGGGTRQRDGEEGNVAHYMWREEQIEQFVYLMKSGEEKRRWILEDYEFEDPFNPPKAGGGADDEIARRGWPEELEERLKNFEDRSDSLVRQMYRRNGWTHSSDLVNPAEEDDGFWSDSDSD